MNEGALICIGMWVGASIAFAVLVPIIYSLKERLRRAEEKAETFRMININQERRFEDFKRDVFESIRKTRPPAALEPDMVKRLLLLCHPDKHANSVASRAATEFLLRLRK